MRRFERSWAWLALVAAGLVPPVRGGEFMKNVWNRPPEGASVGTYVPQTIPNMVGPHGAPVPIMAPGQVAQPTGADYARMQLAQQFPGDVLRQTNAVPGGGVVPASGMMCGPGGCPSPGMPGMPRPGMGMPGMGGPGMGMPGMGGPGMGPPGAVAAVGAYTGGGGGFQLRRTEVRFVGPAGTKISWYAPRTDGSAGFSPQYLEAPARYNFVQASIYRLKLSDIPNRPGVELYPTLEVVPSNNKTATFLAHSAVPVSFTEEDLEQVAAGNFVVKVIYLPDPRFQDLAATGPDEVVSSRLEPGVDPIAEAQRRGSILLVVRLGNIDLEAPNTPAMDAPPAGSQGGFAGAMPGGVVAGPKLPLPPGAAGPPFSPFNMPGAMARPTLPGVPSAPPTAGAAARPASRGTGVPLSAPGLPPGVRPSGTPLGRLPDSSFVQPVSYNPGAKPTIAELAGSR